MPEVKLHSVKATIIGFSWLSSLKGIEIQLTFCGVANVIAVTLYISVSGISQKRRENVVN